MKRTLYILVPAIHLSLLGIIFFSHPSIKPIQSKKLVVKTFTQTSSTAPAIKTKATIPKKAAPPAKKKPPEKKAPSSPLKKETPLPKTKTIQVKKQKSVREEHLKELEERIAKIEVKNDRIPHKSELLVPAPLTLNSSSSLQVPLGSLEYEESSASADIISSLVGYLQGYLHLPDIGEVQIQLTLYKNGKIETMKVIKAESEKNRKYLEEQLPKLSFPGINLDSVSSRSFLLTFCNKF